MTLRAIYAVWILLGLSVVACGGRANGAREADLSGGDDLSDRDTSTEPAATDPHRVRPYLVELLGEHDRVVNQLMADPTLAGDADNPVVVEYRALYEPESAWPDGALEAWTADAAAGLSTRPIDAGHPASTTRLDGELEVVDGNEVHFPTCEERRQIVTERGAVVERTPYVPQQGEGVAVRVDGRWHLRRLDVFVGTGPCRTEAPS